MSETTPPNGGSGSTPLRHGARAVENAQEEHAGPTLAAFVADLHLDGVTHTRNAAADAEGRYGFTLALGDRSCEILMPGLPVERVRRVDQHQKIWEFPRLFVGEQSFVWDYAVRAARRDLRATEVG